MHHLLLVQRIGLVAVLLAIAAVAAGNDRPNILLITPDDLGVQLSCFGDPIANTPANWRSTLVGESHFHGSTPFFPRRAITDGRSKLMHNLRASVTAASDSVDGESSYAEAQELPADHPARAATERRKDPAEWELHDLEKMIRLNSKPRKYSRTVPE